MKVCEFGTIYSDRKFNYIMSSFNFRMLILARESRGLTQTELAKRICVDQAYLSKIEKGWTVSPSEENIEKLCSELKYPKTFFFQQDNLTPISDFFYRKRITISAKEKTKLEAQVNIIRLIYDRLLSSVEVPEARFPSAIASKNFTPADIGKLSREFYKIPKGPVKNLVSLLEKNGVAVFFLDTQSAKFDGMTVYTDSNYPMIILNKNMPNDRKRFTIAHELGHQIMHMPYRFDFEMYEKIKSDQDALEKEADSFAAEFLMPENDCRNDLKDVTYNKLSHLKLFWQVSKRAIVYRAKTLRCIDEKKYSYLMIELSRMGERVRESFDIEIDEPLIVRQVFNAHIRDLEFSQKELADHLSIAEEDLINLVRVHASSKLRIAI